MHATSQSLSAPKRSLWADTCTLAALLSLVALFIHAFGLANLSHAAGAAVVLGLGAASASLIRSHERRHLVTLLVFSLVSYRSVSAFWPIGLPSHHGPIEAYDLVALSSLMVMACLLAVSAQRSSRREG